MAEAALVSLADQGLNLLKILDDAKFDCKALMWVYYSDTDHWRLLLATPLPKGSKLQEPLLKIDSLMAKTPETILPDLSAISVVPPDEPIVQAISKIVSLKGRGAVEFSNNTFNGLYLDKVIIHRTL